MTLWASAFVGIRSASQELALGALTLGRLTIASIALGVLVLARREPLPSRRDLAGIAFRGIFWFGLYNIPLNEAERRVDAGTAAMLINVGPIPIALLAGLVLPVSAQRPKGTLSTDTHRQDSAHRRHPNAPLTNGRIWHP